MNFAEIEPIHAGKISILPIKMVPVFSRFVIQGKLDWYSVSLTKMNHPQLASTCGTENGFIVFAKPFAWINKKQPRSLPFKLSGF